MVVSLKLVGKLLPELKGFAVEEADARSNTLLLDVSWVQAQELCGKEERELLPHDHLCCHL